MSYIRKAKQPRLGMELFYKDTPGHLDQTNLTQDNAKNTDLITRCEFSKQSKRVSLMGRIHADIFHQGCLMLNGLRLIPAHHRQRSTFALQSGK